MFKGQVQFLCPHFRTWTSSGCLSSWSRFPCVNASSSSSSFWSSPRARTLKHKDGDDDDDDDGDGDDGDDGDVGEDNDQDGDVDDDVDDDGASEDENYQ